MFGEKGMEKRFDREPCKMRFSIGDHFERWIRVINLIFNNELVGFLLLTGGSHSIVFSLLNKRFTHKGKEAQVYGTLVFV